MVDNLVLVQIMGFAIFSRNGAFKIVRAYLFLADLS